MTEMERMQNEAVSNARAMYRRRTPPHAVTLTPQQTETPALAEPPQKEQSTQPQQAKKPRADILAPLLEDKERTLIILLIILLSEDGADTGVILALMYCII